MKFTITIKNNTTGKILIKDQTDCIIGVVDLGDSTKKISFLNTTRLDAINCAIKAIEVAEHVLVRIKEENNA